MSRVGRPREASKELLQEAAFELFQLYGYRGTNVEQIARMAGFSRATFFNFFRSKAELFWVETDALLDALKAALQMELATGSPRTLADVLIDFADEIGSAAIPWALNNYRLIEAADDLIASGASRVLGLNRMFVNYLCAELRVAESFRLRAEAADISGKLLVALLEWIDAGSRRSSLSRYLKELYS